VSRVVSAGELLDWIASGTLNSKQNNRTSLPVVQDVIISKIEGLVAGLSLSKKVKNKGRACRGHSDRAIGSGTWYKPAAVSCWGDQKG
jgi:hypothetical protein